MEQREAAMLIHCRGAQLIRARPQMKRREQTPEGLRHGTAEETREERTLMLKLGRGRWPGAAGDEALDEMIGSRFEAHSVAMCCSEPGSVLVRV